MNILMASTFFPPHVGGIEYHVLNISRHLVDNGHRVTVITSLLPKMKLHEMLDGIEIVRIATFFLPGWPYYSLSSVGFAINAEKKMLQIAKEKNVDIVHAHDQHYPLTWSALNMANRLNLPSVLTLHGLYGLNPTKRFGRALEELYNRVIFTRMLEKSTSVIGLTPIVTEYAKKYTQDSENKFWTIPNGVDIEGFSKARPLKGFYRKKYNIPEHVPVFLFRGRFANIKGVLEFAKAASIFAKKCPQAFFLFVGGGPLLGKLEELLKSLHMSSEIVNWVPYSEIPEIYVASDFYVLPSKSEALPLTIMEAMVSNLHIVATQVGGIPDILFNYSNKTYIKGFSPTDIADALENAYFRAALTNTISSQSFENFSWDSITNEIEKVYAYASQKPA